MPVRILIADDHAVFRSALRMLLDGEPDFEVMGDVEDGAKAIELASKEAADVFLLDISMPGPPIAEVITRILEKCPAASIVILTVHEEEVYLQELLKLGVRGYILKKSTATNLIQAIKAASVGKTYIDPALTDRVVASYIGINPVQEHPSLGLLTERQQEVCRLLAYGYTNAEVAGDLHISERTVETHRSNIMSKLGLKDRAGLVRFAIDNGLLTVE